jgi:hypothetical protein
LREKFNFDTIIKFHIDREVNSSILNRLKQNKDTIGLIYYLGREIKLKDRAVKAEKRAKECYKPLKHNVNLANSFSKTVKTQSNHIFLSILAFFKLKTYYLNHFNLKAKF